MPPAAPVSGLNARRRRTFRLRRPLFDGPSTPRGDPRRLAAARGNGSDPRPEGEREFGTRPCVFNALSVKTCPSPAWSETWLIQNIIVIKSLSLGRRQRCPHGLSARRRGARPAQNPLEEPRLTWTRTPAASSWNKRSGSRRATSHRPLADSAKSAVRPQRIDPAGSLYLRSRCGGHAQGR
jgi:hypothetical protein